MTARLTNRWPRIRSRKNGTRTVKGWYTVQWRYAALRRAAGYLLRCCALLFLIMSCFPHFAAGLYSIVPEGTVWYQITNEVIQLLRWPLARLHELTPQYAEQLYLHPSAPFNWAYLVLGIVLYRAAFLLAGPLARLIGLLVPPLIKRPVRVRIDERRVRFWLRGIPRRFVRLPGVQVQFLCEQAGDFFEQHPGRQPTYSTVMRYGHRKIVLAGSMHQRDAQRLALGLSHARDLADGAGAAPGQGSMPPDYAMPMGF